MWSPVVSRDPPCSFFVAPRGRSSSIPLLFRAGLHKYACIVLLRYSSVPASFCQFIPLAFIFVISSLVYSSVPLIFDSFVPLFVGPFISLIFCSCIDDTCMCVKVRVRDS